MTLTKTAKTILFASLIGALILPFGSMNSAFATEPEDVANLTARGEEIIDRLAEIADRSSVRAGREKIILGEELRAIKTLLADQGVYHADEFAQHIDQEIKAHQTAMFELACSSCGPELYFKAAFFWQMNNYWQGATFDPVTTVLTSSGQSGSSQANGSPWWGTDWSWPATVAFVNNANSADITIDMDVMNGQRLSYDPGSHSETVTGDSDNQDVFYEGSYLSPGKANDHHRTTVTLDSIY